MKKTDCILTLVAAVAALVLCGCATRDEYRDEREYSDIPWGAPQQWEGSQSLPGMTPQQY